MSDFDRMPDHLEDRQIGFAQLHPVSDKTILVIDDDPTMVRLVKLVFQAEVKLVLTASEPREGLRLAMTYKPDLICLDNHMPGMSGVEMLAYLRETPAIRDIPVIMLTGDNSEQSVLSAARNKAAAYLLKPCEPDVLYETGIKLLGGDP